MVLIIMSFVFFVTTEHILKDDSRRPNNVSDYPSTNIYNQARTKTTAF